MKAKKLRHGSRGTKFCATSQALANFIAEIAENKKAGNIEIIDVRKNSQICDFFVICSASSAPQFRAIADEIEGVLEKNNINVPHWQGNNLSGWIVLDLFDVVVHIIGTKERSQYNLEDLWAKSGVIYHL